MGYLIVFLVAGAAGIAVFLVTLRAGAAVPAGGLGGESAPAPPEGDYVPVAALRTDWQTRLTGLLGLVITVIVASVVLATSVYVGFSWLIHLIGNTAKSGSPSG